MNNKEMIAIDLGLETMEDELDLGLTVKGNSIGSFTEENKAEAMYVQIPDAHIWDKNLGSHYDYVKEIKETMNIIREEIIKLQPLTERLYVIWDGDLYHKGFKDMDEFGYWYTWFLELRNQVDDMFAVIGNHEFSGYKSNPFWHLISEMESELVPKLQGVAYSPKGKLPILRVVDIIKEGNWNINCIHYGTQVMLEQPNKNIGIFHNSIIDSEIESVLKNKYGRDPLTGFIDHMSIRNNKPFKGMEYAFIAHMHRAYGLFTVEDKATGFSTRLQYLSSVGRTNVNEYNNDDLDRVLPVLCFKHDEVQEVIDIPLRLKSREECINETKVENNKDKYEIQKEYKEFERSVSVIGSPMDELRALLQGNGMLTYIIDTAARGDRIEELNTLTAQVKEGINVDNIIKQLREERNKDEYETEI